MVNIASLYNEIDPFASAWLENLITAGHIAPGRVDRRSIKDLVPADLDGVTQAHFFAGIGVWSYALRLAGWPDDVPVMTGSCPCFPAGTLVLTKRGLLPIETVTVDDSVLTHLSRWRRVIQTGTAIKECITVKGQGHWGLVCTPNHPFYTSDSTWVPAREMAGRRWSTVRKVPKGQIPSLDISRGIRIDERYRNKYRVGGWKNDRSVYLGTFSSKREALRKRAVSIVKGVIDVRGADAVDVTSLKFARFLGYWLGDGWTSRNSVVICGGRTDTTLVRDIMQEANLSCSLSVERTSVRARCGSKKLVTWLNTHFGQGAAFKRLPAWIFGVSAAYRDAFIAGYAEADGHVETNQAGTSAQAFTTVSPALAVGVRILLNQAGLSVTISRSLARGGKTVIENRVVNERPLYQLTAYRKGRSFKFSKQHGHGLVRRLMPAGTQRVYNLAVEEDESYTADGIVVHNCQGWSQAGKQKGFEDERHLWPAWFELIRKCRPPVIFGEQVASPIALAWLDAVSTDLENEGYAVGAADLCAAGIGAPHLRQRLYFAGIRRDLADGQEIGRRSGRIAQPRRRSIESDRSRDDGIMADDDDDGFGKQRSQGLSSDRDASCGDDLNGRGAPCRSAVGHADGDGVGRNAGTAHRTETAIERSTTGWSADGTLGDGLAVAGRSLSLSRNAWEPCDWIPCRDGKWRPVEPGTFPLAHGAPARVGRLRGYGNALCAPLAAEFIRSVMDVLGC